ncbi:MAG: NUDIX domain-containing protein [Candidatus Liptonbacteria bacterium]|nr:NUDIX domain-containing protein [Candidatus Liptonbacteria bacterium]
MGSQKEGQCYIVDENDQVIGYKPRSEIQSADIYRVSGLLVVNEYNEMLIAQRSFSKEYDPGKWGPAAAGTVEKGETYETNIRKEAKEELGLENLDLKLGPKERKFGGHNYFAQRFIARISKDTPLVLQKEEVAAVRWVSRADLERDVREHPDHYFKSAPSYFEGIDE